MKDLIYSNYLGGHGEPHTYLLPGSGVKADQHHPLHSFVGYPSGKHELTELGISVSRILSRWFKGRELKTC